MIPGATYTVWCGKCGEEKELMVQFLTPSIYILPASPMCAFCEREMEIHVNG